MKSRRNASLRNSLVRIESLEYRRVLSNVDAFRDSAMDADLVPDLRITGDAGGDNTNNIDVYIDFANRRTIVHDDRDFIGSVNPGELYIYDTLFETIDIICRSQNDTARVFFVTDFGCEQFPAGELYSPFGGDDYGGAALSIYGDLGSGNDTFYLGTQLVGNTPNGLPNVTPNAITPASPVNTPIEPGSAVNLGTFDPDGADLCCADLVVEVDGGTGDDRITYDFKRISIKGSLVTLNADGQDNNDNLTLNLPDSDCGEDGIIGENCHLNGDTVPNVIPVELTPTLLDVNFATGTGTNTVNINTATTIRDGSIVNIAVEGNSGADTVNAKVNLDVHWWSRFYLNADLFGGNDRLLARYDFSPDGISTTRETIVHLGGTGGDGSDTLEVTNLAAPGDTSSAQAGQFVFDLKGGNGNDKVQAQIDAPVAQADVFLDWAFDGGIKAYLNGDGGNDFVEFDAQLKSSPILDIAVMGGSGDDKLVLAVHDFDPLSLLRYVAPRNAMLIDGGTGFDTWDQDGFSTRFTTRGVDRQDDSLELNDLTVLPPV